MEHRRHQSSGDDIDPHDASEANADLRGLLGEDEPSAQRPLTDEEIKELEQELLGESEHMSGDPSAGQPESASSSWRPPHIPRGA